jgi:hypothetical protein
VTTFKATRAISVAGKPVAAGESFEADEQAVRVALAKGWIERVEEQPKRKAAGGRRTKR